MRGICLNIGWKACSGLQAIEDPRLGMIQLRYTTKAWGNIRWNVWAWGWRSGTYSQRNNWLSCATQACGQYSLNIGWRSALWQIRDGDVLGVGWRCIGEDVQRSTAKNLQIFGCRIRSTSLENGLIESFYKEISYVWNPWCSYVNQLRQWRSMRGQTL